MKYFAYCRKSSEAEERQALSLESQSDELRQAFVAAAGVTIVDWLEESMSAKSPGRPIFNSMLERIRRGEADGIIAWHPDRLARNSVDGGLIIYMLDQGVIKDLRFANFSFENSSQGKFMLQIMFGYSKYYVDNLSENVHRGNRAKASRGWRPGNVPVGYRNCRETRTIVPDPATFPLIQRMFRLALQRTHTVSDLWRIVTHQWGLRTPRRARSGGGIWALSAFYRAIRNEFYTGQFLYQGTLYRGNHPAAVSISDFALIQEWIGRTPARRPSRQQFAFTGLIRCAACGLMVTAEHKRNRQGRRHYVYYHCSKRNVGPRCRQPSVEVRALTAQIVEFLESLRIDDEIDRDLRARALDLQNTTDDSEATKASIRKALDSAKGQEATLLDLRVRGLISDEEFLLKRQEAQRERHSLDEALEAVEQGMGWFELFEDVISFSKRAAEWFQGGTEDVQRLILQTVGSNLRLTDGKLSIDAAFPFSAIRTMPVFLPGCPLVEDVRNRLMMRDSELLKSIENIREVKRLATVPGESSEGRVLPSRALYTVDS